MIHDILRRMGYANCTVSQFHSKEDGSTYDVWRLDTPDGIRVLKKAKGSEAQMYNAYFSLPKCYAPRLYQSLQFDGATYLLMEYIPGEDMTRASREALTRTLDSLIAMQKEYWLEENRGTVDPNCLQSRINRRNYLKEPILQQAYDAYLTALDTMQLTLCHDDLLPFNVIISQDRAVLIDWEVGGILPYPTSLARLIAHCSEEKDTFFFMKDADKAFAIDYYYNNLIEKMGITKAAFDRDLALCLLYEYCEWVYVGNKYPDADQARYHSYLTKALQQAQLLGFKDQK